MEPNRTDGRGWPRAIIIGLAFVVLVNALFAYMALRDADPVVSSYNTEPR